MSRRRRRGEDGTFDIANDPLQPLLTPTSPPVRVVDPFEGLNLLLEVQDNRLFHPEAADRPPLDFSGGLARVVANDVAPRSSANRTARPDASAFANPQSALVCARRAIRKQVLFAKGFRKRVSRRRRRGPNSDIRC